MHRSVGEEDRGGRGAFHNFRPFIGRLAGDELARSQPAPSSSAPPPRAIKPPTRSKQPRDLRSTLDLQKENIASRMEGTVAVAHSPLLTTPINHLNSGSACCPTHAKDGRDGRSARLEGRKALPGSFRSHRRPRWRWLGTQEGLRERASTPFQTDDHSCENGRGGSGRRSERQNACEAA